MLYQYQLLTPFDPDEYDVQPWWRSFLPLVILCFFALLLSPVPKKPMVFPNHFMCYVVSEYGMLHVGADLMPVNHDSISMSICKPRYPSMHTEYAVLLVFHIGEYPVIVPIMVLEKGAPHA